MFPKLQSDKPTIKTPTDDVECDSTCFVCRSTIGNLSQGNSMNHRNKREGGQQQAEEKNTNGRGSVIAVACMIIFLGIIAGSAMAYLGCRAEWNGRMEDFERGASVTVSKIEDSFKEYVDTASLIHGRFRHRPRFSESAFESDPETYTAEYMEWSEEHRRDLRELYEYVKASGLKFKSMQFDPNVTWQERPLAEAEVNAYLMQNYPEITYTGFRGFNNDSTKLEPIWQNQSFYFPIHYIEPIQGNEAAIDLDYYSSESRIRAVDALFETQAPSLTDRLSLFREAGSVSRCNSGGFSGDQGPSFMVVLMHPGVRLSGDDDTSWPRDFSSIVLCMSDLIERSTNHQNRKISVYIHDLSHPGNNEPVFMGAARLDKNATTMERVKGDDHYTMILLNEISLGEVECSWAASCYQREIEIANRNWTVTIVDEHVTDKGLLFFIILVGIPVFAAFACLAISVLAADRKNRTFSILKAEAAATRSSMVLESANRTAQMERELNDFLAHEVRNPLSAAMAATSFLRTELDRRSKSNRGIGVHFEDSHHEKDKGKDEQKEFAVDEIDATGGDKDARIKTLASPRLVQAREDIQVVDNALRFINELLRNMLDMNRASSGKLQVKSAPVDLLRDVLEPVAGMLYRGGEGNIGRSGKGIAKVQMIVDCPEDIIVQTDVLRLKQVVLNLGRNSVKFVHDGFIRMKAEVVEVDCDDDSSKLRGEFENSSYQSHDTDIECGNNLTSELRYIEGRSISCKTVRISVEDSGSGIPMEKRERLFGKYQESLDLLSQGTVRITSQLMRLTDTMFFFLDSSFFFCFLFFRLFLLVHYRESVCTCAKT
jgi:signal transduction histidine kinase